MRRLFASLLSLLLLSACGEPAGEAFLDSRTPPSLTPRFWPPEGWAWGAIRVEGAPEIRYGVASPHGRPVGHVVLVPGYGESAEVYFETARDLLAEGYAVWTLEPHGQGGSGRFSRNSDVGRSGGFDKDAAAIRSLVEQVIRPARAETVVLAAHGSGALPVLLALEGGLGRVDRAVLSEPDLVVHPDPARARRLAQLGLGRLRADGGAWRRPSGDLSRRATLAEAWQTANPDLRLGGPGWSWFDAEGRAVRRIIRSKALQAIRTPIIVMAPADRPAATLCRAMAVCTLAATPPGPPPHLAADEPRSKWLQLLQPPADPPLRQDASR